MVDRIGIRHRLPVRGNVRCRGLFDDEKKVGGGIVGLVSQVTGSGVVRSVPTLLRSYFLGGGEGGDCGGDGKGSHL